MIKIVDIYNTLIKHLSIYGKMIKFSHTIFALPFVLSAIVLVWREKSIAFMEIFWILIAMTGARSAAMGFNRIIDAKIDAKNPRTAKREIPAGILSMKSAVCLTIFFAIMFIFSAGMLGYLPLCFSIPVLGLLFFYSYTKRFTSFCHIYLGFVISLSPIGVWIALTNTLTFPIIVLSLALMTNIAGFDILYACQDMEFDKKHGLFSLPARFGIKTSLQISSIIHIFSFLFFVLLYWEFNLGTIYLITALIIGILLIIEHKLVIPDDLSNLHIAFFHINSIISVTLFTGILLDV